MSTAGCLAPVLALGLAVATTGCGRAPITREGSTQLRVVGRTYASAVDGVRARLLEAFSGRRPALSDPFVEMRAFELKPPAFPPDWLTTFVDPGRFLADYKELPAELRRADLLIEDPTGDSYWPSEYRSPAGQVRFRCGFIAHFIPLPTGTTVEIYEKVPTVWLGERWAFSAHGVGFGRYHDIRFVEPTVRDRMRLLDLIGAVVVDPASAAR
jgi:hypothetical protein